MLSRSAVRVVNETYDAETETRPRRQSLEIETRSRRDVQNNVSRRSVETRDVQAMTIVIRAYTTSTV